ncbi:hypothetical protein BH10PLA1_BH10PLA1_20920 [soil metagenome]
MHERPLGNPDAVPVRPERIAYSMRALGKSGLPATIHCDLGRCAHVLTVKHDFYAATGFYVSDTGEHVVLKVSRTTDFAGLPLQWLGRWLCTRELHFYRKLADLPNVPRVLGSVGKTGFAHSFIAGHPLSKDQPVPDGFFDRLASLFEQLHDRGIAYVDTNKPQNILLGDDGQPYLIDFQISWDSEVWHFKRLSRWILHLLRTEDRYHLLKHKNRLRPDELTREERQRAEHRSWLIRAHRFIFRPYFLLRRRTFKRLRSTGRLLPEGTK